MKFGLKHLLLSTALFGVVAPVAAAQDNPFIRGRYEPVDQRRQPEFDPEVIHAGGFNINSSLSLGAEYNDNVFALPSNEQDDTIIRIRPSVEAVSNWTVHQLVAGVNLDHREYTSNDSETSTDYDAYLRGRLDATRMFQLNGTVDVGHTTEERYEPASTGSPEPAQTDFVAATAGATFRSDRLQFQATVGTRQDDYQSFFNYRDVTSTGITGRASYAMSPDVAFFVQARSNELDYDQTGSLRNSTQTSIEVGTSFELTAPFRGDISIGQVKDNKDSSTQPDTEGLSLNATIQWFPTQLTTVTFHGNAGINDPGIAQATSAKFQNYSIRADHELLRNVVLFGQFGFGSYDFETPTGSLFSRNDDFTDLSVGAAYKLNKHAHLEFAYTMHTQETSGTLNTDVDQHIIGASIKFYP